MTSAGRLMLYRIELRLAEMCGAALEEKERLPLDGSWYKAVVQAWFQVNYMLKTGQARYPLFGGVKR